MQELNFIRFILTLSIQSELSEVTISCGTIPRTCGGVGTLNSWVKNRFEHCTCSIYIRHTQRRTACNSRIQGSLPRLLSSGGWASDVRKRGRPHLCRYLARISRPLIHGAVYTHIVGPTYTHVNGSVRVQWSRHAPARAERVLYGRDDGHVPRSGSAAGTVSRDASFLSHWTPQQRASEAAQPSKSKASSSLDFFIVLFVKFYFYSHACWFVFCFFFLSTYRFRLCFSFICEDKQMREYYIF